MACGEKVVISGRAGRSKVTCKVISVLPGVSVN